MSNNQQFLQQQRRIDRIVQMGFNAGIHVPSTSTIVYRDF